MITLKFPNPILSLELLCLSPMGWPKITGRILPAFTTLNWDRALNWQCLWWQHFTSQHFHAPRRGCLIGPMTGRNWWPIPTKLRLGAQRTVSQLTISHQLSNVPRGGCWTGPVTERSWQLIIIYSPRRGCWTDPVTGLSWQLIRILLPRGGCWTDPLPGLRWQLSPTVQKSK